LLTIVLMTGLSGYSIYRIITRKTYTNVLAFSLILGVTFLLYQFIPDYLLGGYIMQPRISLIFYLTLILFFACYTTGFTQSRPAMLLFTLLALGYTTYRTVQFYQINQTVNEIIAAEAYIPNRAVVLPYSSVAFEAETDRHCVRSNRYVDISNYLCLNKEAVRLLNYEATYDYFPLMWRPDRALNYVDMASITNPVSQTVPGVADFEKKARTAVSHVVLIGVDESDPVLLRSGIPKELHRRYRRTYVSPNRLVSVYEANPLPFPERKTTPLSLGEGLGVRLEAERRPM